MNYNDYYSDELLHYGRKGMKWGQNIFGDLQDQLQKNRYGTRIKNTVLGGADYALSNFTPRNIRNAYTNGKKLYPLAKKIPGAMVDVAAGVTDFGIDVASGGDPKKRAKISKGIINTGNFLRKTGHKPGAMLNEAVKSLGKKAYNKVNTANSKKFRNLMRTFGVIRKNQARGGKAKAMYM